MLRVILFFAALLSAFTPAHAVWRKATSPSFTVYGEMGEDQLIAFTQKVERFDSFLRKRFGIPAGAADVRLTIFAVNERVQIDRLMGVVKPNVAGLFTSGPLGPVAILKRYSAANQFELNAETILFHEYGHFFMRHYFPAPYPAWFSEGFAEFLSTTSFDKEGRASYGMPAHHRALDLVYGKPLPINTLLNADVDALKGEERAALYAQGWLLTHFLHFSPGREGQLEKYLQVINTGTDIAKAARDVFGDSAKLQKELTAYLNARKMSILKQSKPTPVTTDIKISLVDEANGAAMLQRFKAMVYSSTNQQGQTAVALAKMAAANPTNAELQTLTALAHYNAEDWNAALAAANIALAASVDYGPALLIKAKAEMRQMVRDSVVDPGRWKAIRSNILKANKQDLDDPFALYWYYTSFRNQGIEPTANAISALKSAAEKLPEDQSIRSAWFEHLANTKKYAEAAQLLRVVAYDPHGGAEAAEAREMIAKLEKTAKTGTALAK